MPPPPPPPDLRALCRKLASTPPDQLALAIPALTRHATRCSQALRASPQLKAKGDDASQTALLVHRLKTTITAFLTGRVPEARLVAVALIRAVVDVGGWETLRTSDPWVRGLLCVVQKGDAAASQELAIVTLARIYTLLHPYQTLAREIATPTIPAFATACLQLLNPTACSPAPTPSASLMTAVFDAYSTLVPLYPTTFRPFSTRARAAVRSLLAPTSCDAASVLRPLQGAAGRLAVTLHHVAAKSGGSDEWAKMVDDVIRELHATADQVLRAVIESWDPPQGYGRTALDLGRAPSGGSESPENLPPWMGLSAGAERLIGLYSHLARHLQCPTRGPVTFPVGAAMDAVSRACLIANPSPRSKSWDQACETNATIGREEKDELWSILPDIHVAALELAIAMLRRFDMNVLPLVPELLGHLVRVFKSGISIPELRKTGYLVLHNILSLAGPTMSKMAVGMIEIVAAACCRDLQQAAGLLKPAINPTNAAPDFKKNHGIANADLFLHPSDSPDSAPQSDLSLEPQHRDAAGRLLPLLLSHLPQRHLKPNMRGLLDKTAILTRCRDAMQASVLHPYHDQRGSMYPSILPHLTRQYPHDQGLEILRTNLRLPSVLADIDGLPITAADDDALKDAEPVANDPESPAKPGPTGLDGQTSGIDGDVVQNMTRVETSVPIHSSPFIPVIGAAENASPLIVRLAESPPPKRKHDDSSDPHPPKRHELDTRTAAAGDVGLVATSFPAGEGDLEDHGGDGDDSDVSVHLNMKLDDDDEEKGQDLDVE